MKFFMTRNNNVANIADGLIKSLFIGFSAFPSVNTTNFLENDSAQFDGYSVDEELFYNLSMLASNVGLNLTKIAFDFTSANITTLLASLYNTTVNEPSSSNASAATVSPSTNEFNASSIALPTNSRAEYMRELRKDRAEFLRSLAEQYNASGVFCYTSDAHALTPVACPPNTNRATSDILTETTKISLASALGLGSLVFCVCMTSCLGYQLKKWWNEKHKHNPDKNKIHDLEQGKMLFSESMDVALSALTNADSQHKTSSNNDNASISFDSKIDQIELKPNDNLSTSDISKQSHPSEITLVSNSRVDYSKLQECVSFA